MAHRMYPVLVLLFPAALLLTSVPASTQQSCENRASLKVPGVPFASTQSISPPWEFPASGSHFLSEDQPFPYSR